MPRADAGRLRCTVLLVDDDEELLRATEAVLERDGMSVVAALSAREGFLAAVDQRPDIAVVDVQMPEEDGLSLCRRLKSDRRTARMPVLLLSGALTAVRDQVGGLAGGADDYLCKPLSLDLLAAKIRAVLRRLDGDKVSATLKTSGLELDPDARRVRIGKRAVRLTRKEFDLLAVLVRGGERVQSIPQLLESVWGYDPARYNDPATVHAHVSSLRRKLGPKIGARIVSEPGLGYHFTGTPSVGF